VKTDEEKRVRWGDHGEWCNLCVEDKAVYSGLCKACHALPEAPHGGIVIGEYTLKPARNGQIRLAKGDRGVDIDPWLLELELSEIFRTKAR
jgi:hypothetical protein